MKQIKLPKPGKYGTINRQSLKKLMALGALEAKCDFSYTDDYAFDNSINCGKTEWIPAAYVDVKFARHENRIEGSLVFGNWDFETSSGKCWIDKDGTYSLSVHSNLSYSFRVKNTL